MPGHTPIFRSCLAAVIAVAAAIGSAVIVGGAHASSSPADGVVDVNTTLAFGQGQAAGTGIVLRSTGLVLTNNHVIRGATRIRATVPGTGRSYAATVLGYNVSADIAVLRLTGASGLKAAQIGNSAPVRTGDPVTAVGNAGGVGGAPSVTTGQVRALHQSITVSDASGETHRLVGLIHSTALVEPGDSGGPLLNSSGKVIGITAAAANGSGFGFRAGGSGFAIPINRAITTARQIEARRSSSAVHIGATAYLGIFTGGSVESAGALVTGVLPGGAAAAAGLSMGDTVTAFAGRAVSSPEALVSLVLQAKPGSPVQVTYVDQSGQTFTTRVTPAAGPPQ